MKVPKGQPFWELRLNGKTWGEMTEEEHQRTPGDYEAQAGQGPISLHSEEHLVTSDRGIMMQRTSARAADRGRRQGRRSARRQFRSRQGAGTDPLRQFLPHRTCSRVGRRHRWGSSTRRNYPAVFSTLMTRGSR